MGKWLAHWISQKQVDSAYPTAKNQDSSYNISGNPPCQQSIQIQNCSLPLIGDNQFYTVYIEKYFYNIWFWRCVNHFLSCYTCRPCNQLSREVCKVHLQIAKIWLWKLASPWHRLDPSRLLFIGQITEPYKCHVWSVINIVNFNILSKCCIYYIILLCNIYIPFRIDLSYYCFATGWISCIKGKQQTRLQIVNQFFLCRLYMLWYFRYSVNGKMNGYPDC